jgi:hypothetical protein
MAMLEVFTKFENLEIEYVNARLKTQETKSKVGAGLLPEQALRDAIDAERECRLRFKGWCVPKRDGILQMLDDPNLSPADREALQRFCDDVANRLPDLEANDMPPA